MENAEDQSTRAHAERQHDRADYGQAGIAAQAAQRLAQLRRDRLQGCAQANVAYLFLHLFPAPHFEPCCAARSARVDAAAYLFIHQHFFIGAELGFQIGFHGFLARQIVRQCFQNVP